MLDLEYLMEPVWLLFFLKAFESQMNDEVQKDDCGHCDVRKVVHFVRCDDEAIPF